ncbi:hypothetical protein N4P33_17675 [Streptomyces sp. 15-116A]|uniref:hypothetical protein n=1 Tax=Streptomyces sp. 15-116A TaxID=2259035 RepID=UPI0021B1DF5B|nr:hypothetical protein [Streptomyces sp. 15-116A]MCT7353973.1 hypothetical protein [Streptomyces sp. 15-116A]
MCAIAEFCGGASSGTTVSAPAPETATPGADAGASPSDSGNGLPTGPAPGASSAVEEAFRAARVVALQSNLAHIDPALGTPDDITKADAQCADLARNVSAPDRVAAKRFSTDKNRVTETDGKRINTLLRNTCCG